MVRDAPRAVRAERTPTLAVAPNLNPSPNPNSDPEPLTRALTSTLPPATRLNAVWLMRRVVGFWGRRMLGTCYRQWKSTTLEGHATQQRGRRAVALWQGRNAAAALARLSYACAAQAAARAVATRWIKASVAAAWRTWGGAVAARLAARGMAMRWLQRSVAAAFRTLEAAAEARAAARRNGARWLNMMLAKAWRTWAERPPPSDALQRAAGAWAGRAMAPAWRKLAAPGADRRMLRRALAGWAQRELASAWRQWDGLAAEQAVVQAQARRALATWTGNGLLGAVAQWRAAAVMAISARQHGSMAVRRWQQQGVVWAMKSLSRKVRAAALARRAARAWGLRTVAAAFRQWSWSGTASALASLRRIFKGISRAFRRWAAEHRKRVRARACVRCMRHQRAARALRTWATGAAAEAHAKAVPVWICAGLADTRAQGLGWRTWKSVHMARCEALATARLALGRWRHRHLSRAFGRWNPRVYAAAALRQAGAAWAAAAVAPAWRKLLACLKMRGQMRRALVGWAQRELASAWRSWGGMTAGRAAAVACLDSALRAFSGRSAAAALRRWHDLQAAWVAARRAVACWRHGALGAGMRGWAAQVAARTVLRRPRSEQVAARRAVRGLCGGGTGQP